MPLLRLQSVGARFINGALLALIAGVLITLLPDSLTLMLGLQHGPGNPFIFITCMALSMLLAGAGAWVARSWWAGLALVPVVYFVGYIIGTLLDLNLPGMTNSPGYFTLVIMAFVFLYLVPLLLVTAIATAISKRLAARRAVPA